ncbi:ankyrin repeat-containing domain protein [Ilyonectria destructans]|nr:ankyrin repeat-containing domain protein [Ilyonectria destructans]
MSLTQRIPTAAWDAHKEQIRMLYVVQDKTLDDTIKSMNEDHGFLATKSQYVRKLKNWGMEKYINGDKWKIAFDLIQKRKRSGKKTELSIDGKVIPVKRMKKEMSRYSYAQCGFGGLSVMPADASSGIIAHTPPSNDTFRVTFNTIPWLRFQSSMGSASFHSGIQFPLLRVENSRPSGIINLIPEMINDPLAHITRSDYLLFLPSSLEEEAKTREDNYQAQQLLQSQPLLRILQHAVYMSSNSRLSTQELDNFAKWLEENEYSWAIEGFAQLEGPSIEIFASNLLLSAIRCQKVVLVRALLIGGVNPNSCSTSFYSYDTALFLAVDKLNLDIVELLLRHGADPNGSGSSEDTILDLFGESEDIDAFFDEGEVSDGVQIVDLLIKAGAKVAKFNSPFAEKCLTNSLESGMMWPVELMAKAGAFIEPIGDLINLEFQSAVWRHDSEMVRALVDHGADVNCPSYYPTTNGWDTVFELAKPIAIAASQNILSMVQLLLELGANANGIVSLDDLRARAKGVPEGSLLNFYHGTPALHHAVIKGSTTMVELLLQWGADVNATDVSIGTPFRAACASKQSDINAPEGVSQDITALEVAIKSGGVRMVKLLLHHGAITNSTSSAAAALRAAVKTGKEELVALLLDVNANFLHLDSAIVHLAAEHSAPAGMVRCLLNAGAPVEDVISYCEPSDRCTPLEMAVQDNNLELVKLLLEYGADISHVKGITPITKYFNTQSRADWIELVLTLVKGGADINAYRCSPNTCPFLQASIKSGDFAMVRFLLDKGADPISCLSPELSLPLHGVMEVMNETFVNETSKTLIALGADVNAYSFISDIQMKDLPGNLWWTFRAYDVRLQVTPLQAAVWYCKRRAMGILLQAGANINGPAAEGFGFTALQVAICRQHNELVDSLLEAGANINAPAASESGFTALQAAILTGNDDLAKRLLVAGAEINAPGASTRGMTALQAAVFKDSGALIQQLLSRGADINASPCEHRGATALQYAAMKGSFDLVVQLLKDGANINAARSASEGRTALEGAAEQGRLDIVHLLLENDHEVELLEERCKEAAKFACEEGHMVIARLLREWKRP